MLVSSLPIKLALIHRECFETVYCCSFNRPASSSPKFFAEELDRPAESNFTSSSILLDALLFEPEIPLLLLLLLWLARSCCFLSEATGAIGVCRTSTKHLQTDQVSLQDTNMLELP